MDRKEYNRQYYLKNKDKILSAAIKHQKENKELANLRKKKWRENNKEKALRAERNYRKNNPDKRKESIRKYDKNHRHVGRAKCSKYRAKKGKASLDYNKYKNEILNIYKNCPEGYHVDHIVPINSDLVCGLHVPWNLQYLTIEENCKKGNKLEWS